MDIIEANKIIASDPKHAREPHDARYEDGSAFTQGRVRPINEGMVPIQDMGFIHADAAYDVVSAGGGYIFRLEDHLKRFNRSCEKFRLKNPYSDDETKDILVSCVRKAGLKDAYIWWAVTRGRAPKDRTKPAFDFQFYAYVTPYSFIFDDDTRRRGAHVNVSASYERISPRSVDPTAKNFHWMDMKLSLLDAYEKGAEWSVLANSEGNLTEAPGCNVFLIKDGVIRTPATGCLEGITRQTVIDLAAETNVPLEVTDIPAAELAEADEAFLTSTAGGIMPVSIVDNVALGGRKGPGKITTQLHNLYWTKRWDGWLGTPIEYPAHQGPPDN